MSKSIGEVLKEARKAQKLSIYAVAEATGLTPTTISRLENRENDDARFKTVVKVGAVIGLSPGDIATAVGIAPGEDTQLRDVTLQRLLDEIRRLNLRITNIAEQTNTTMHAIELKLSKYDVHEE